MVRCKMDEFKFVLKSFFIACLLMLGSQYKINNQTIESHVASFMTVSPVAQGLQKSASGGVKILGETYENVLRTITSYKNEYLEHKKIQTKHNQAKAN